MPAAVFVTGSDTGVGKTLVACALLASARDDGLSSLGLKPVAAGCERQNGQWVNQDALALQALSSTSPDYGSVNPVALPEPVAPHIAAAADGQRLIAGELGSHCRRVMKRLAADFTVVEGAGGWLAPINESQTMADLAVSLALPVLLVVGMRLGCLNHALLSAAAIEARGLPLAGWVANFPQPMAGARANVESLQERLCCPCIGCIPALGPRPDPAAAAAHLDRSALRGSDDA